MDRKTRLFILSAAGAAGVVFAVRKLLRKDIDTLPYGYGVKLKRSVTINCPRERLYLYWRNLENLPKLFDNIISVDAAGSCSHWTLRAPGGMTLQWDAELTVDRENEMIGWRSLDGAEIDNAGYVRFERATGGRGTVVRVALQYNPPAGRLGAALSALVGESPAGQIDHALRTFKQLMEAGESATIDERALPHSKEVVQAASEDSFPASDAPSWTGTTGPIV